MLGMAQGRAMAPASSSPLDIYVTAVRIHFLLTALACPPSALCRISLMLLRRLGDKTVFYFYFIPPLSPPGLRTL